MDVNKNIYKRQKSISFYNNHKYNLFEKTPKLILNLNNSKDNNNINSYNNQDIQKIIIPSYNSNNENSNSFSNSYKPILKNDKINNFIDENDENKNENYKLTLKIKENYLFNRNRALTNRLTILNNSPTNNSNNNLNIRSYSNRDSIKIENQNKLKDLNLETNENKINNNTINDYFFKKKINNNIESKFKKTSSIFRSRNNLNTNLTTFNTNVVNNPFQILEEDKIFDERKKYLFYKYEKRKNKNKNKNNMNNKTINNFNRKIQKDNINININSLKIKKIKEKKKKLISSDKKRLNYLYLSTNKINKKLKIIKNKKNKQSLKEYQYNLLDIIKPSISDYNYIYLKNKLNNIRTKTEIKKNNNIKIIKQIEMEEKSIINEFNDITEKYLKTFDNEIKNKTSINFYKKSKIEFPLIDFISCFKKKNKIKK